MELSRIFPCKVVSAGRFCVCKYLSCRVLLDMLFELDICRVWEVLKLFSFILQNILSTWVCNQFCCLIQVYFWRFLVSSQVGLVLVTLLVLPVLLLVMWIDGGENHTYLWINTGEPSRTVARPNARTYLVNTHIPSTLWMWWLPTYILDICVVFYVLPGVALQKKSEIARLAWLIPYTKKKSLRK